MTPAVLFVLCTISDPTRSALRRIDPDQRPLCTIIEPSGATITSLCNSVFGFDRNRQSSCLLLLTFRLWTQVRTTAAVHPTFPGREIAIAIAAIGIPPRLLHNQATTSRIYHRSRSWHRRKLGQLSRYIHRRWKEGHERYPTSLIGLLVCRSWLLVLKRIVGQLIG